MLYEIKNKVALVTGAATGIGEYIVRYLLNEGAKYVAVLDVNDSAGVALEKELNSKFNNQKLKFIKCDVSDEPQLLGAFKTVLDDNGTLDIVINNAGIMNDSMEVYKKAIEVNVTALITSTLKALEIMRKDSGGKGGTIINISSERAYIRHQILSIYGATKSAVLHFSNCIGVPEYYAKTGVRVITMCFGPTDTPLLSPTKIGSFDKEIENELLTILKQKNYSSQSAETAAMGVIEAYKRGESGSTWLIISGEPVKDISPTITKAYDLLSSLTN